MSFLSHRDTFSPHSISHSHRHQHIVTLSLSHLGYFRSQWRKIDSATGRTHHPHPTRFPLLQDGFFFGTCSRGPLAQPPSKLCDSP